MLSPGRALEWPPGGQAGGCGPGRVADAKATGTPSAPAGVALSP